MMFNKFVISASFCLLISSGAITAASSSEATPSENNGLFSRISHWWNSEKCRDRKEALQDAGVTVKNRIRRHPAEVMQAAGGVFFASGYPIAGASLFGVGTAGQQASQTTQSVLHQVDQMCSNQQQHLQQTFNRSTRAIADNGHRVIESIRENGNDVVNNLNTALTTQQANLQQTFQAGTNQLNQAAERAVDSINTAATSATQRFNTGLQNNARFYAKTGIQSLLLTASGTIGATLLYKNLINHIDQKSTILASVGAGLLAGSGLIANWLFKPEQAVTTQATDCNPVDTQVFDI